MAREKETKEFVDTVVAVRRVTKVTKGGKRFSFSALVVSGDQNGKVGLALGKGNEVQAAIMKATNRARKHLIDIARRGTTIPYDVHGHHGANKVVVRPAYKGTGVIAGASMRAVFDAAGIKDVIAKSVRPSANAQGVVKATLNALAKLRTVGQLERLRGKALRKAKETNVQAA